MTKRKVGSIRSSLMLWAGCLMASTIAQGADVYLRTGVITNAMPDGSNVVMWGFSRDSSDADDDGAVTVPGPELVVTHADSSLTIHLDNRLPVPVSIVIPGLVGSSGPVPVRSLTDGRAMSFTHEAPPGGTATYTWNNLRPGLFLYQSGSHPAVQVQMGLYGALKKDAGVQLAYAGVPYSTPITLLFSEIDPALHHAVATANYGPGLAMSSTVDYSPRYFMINGLCYTNGAAPIDAGHPGGNVLLRLLNAGLRTHIPIVNGAYLKLVAEDGFAYSYPKTQYSAFLAAGKTIDAIFTPDTTNRFALYDRAQGLVNRMNSPGGMLAYLNVSGMPTWTLTMGITPAASGSVTSSPLPQLDGTYTNGTVVTVSTSPNRGFLFDHWSGDLSGSLSTSQITMTADRSVLAHFIRRPAQLFWQLPTGRVASWVLQPNGTLRNTFNIYTNTTTWQVRAIGDMNNDNVSDLIWQLPTGQTAVWFMRTNGTAMSTFNTYTNTTTWMIRGAGDINGDGVADLIWQLPTGQVSVWFMNAGGTKNSGFNIYTGTSPWVIRGVGDIDGDGIADLIWQDPTTGKVTCWFMNANGTTRSTFNVSTSTSLWQIRGVADVDGDGIGDLIWQYPSSGGVVCWLMNANGTMKSSINISTGLTSWLIKATGN
ncbi:MAG: FG-GAP-like repeat-containing protein [bacterium]